MLSRIPLVQVRSVTVIVSLLVMWMLAGCASEPIQQQVVMSEPVNDARPHRLKIVNHSSDVMNVILYKPCGSKVDLIYFIFGKPNYNAEDIGKTALGETLTVLPNQYSTLGLCVTKHGH